MNTAPNRLAVTIHDALMSSGPCAGTWRASIAQSRRRMRARLAAADDPAAPPRRSKPGLPGSQSHGDRVRRADTGEGTGSRRLPEASRPRFVAAILVLGVALIVAAPAQSGEKGPELRRQAMVESAHAHAAAAAMAERARAIAATLETSAADLDRIYRFDALVLHRAGFVIAPPVLVEVRDAIRTAPDGSRAASARQVLRIAERARILSATPDWRDWLVRSWPEPGPVHSVLLPRTPEEQAAFDAAQARGERDGIALADAVHAEDLDRLNRDWLGMIAWHRRAASGMVTEPVVRTENVPVSGGGRVLRIDETVLDLADPARLNPVMQLWSPLDATGGKEPRP